MKPFTLATLLLLISTVGNSAPLPTTRPITKADIVGRWIVYWGNTPYLTEFASNGGYMAQSYMGTNEIDSIQYVGTWEVKDGLLHINEQYYYPDKREDYGSDSFTRSKAVIKVTHPLYSGEFIDGWPKNAGCQMKKLSTQPNRVKIIKVP